MDVVCPIVHGVVTGFWIGERALTVKLKVGPQRHLLLQVFSWRPDFVGQIELVKYALSMNEDHDIRLANGYETLAPKMLWAQLESPPPETWEQMSKGSEPPVATAVALGLGNRQTNPFDSSFEGF